jgi:hypothetical protein
MNQVNSIVIQNLIWKYLFKDEQLMNIDKELKEIDQTLERSILAVQEQ